MYEQATEQLKQLSLDVDGLSVGEGLGYGGRMISGIGQPYRC